MLVLQENILNAYCRIFNRLKDKLLITYQRFKNSIKNKNILNIYKYAFVWYLLPIEININYSAIVYKKIVTVYKCICLFNNQIVLLN